MIHLNLKKFKQFSDLQIELPNSGLIMIAGHSGAGKTSVFEAVREALWGNCDDAQPWGGSKSCVEMTAWGLHIIRTRGSKSLIVNGKPDAQGEELISNCLRMDVNEFMASSYIQQEQKNSLLSLTPAEQLRFVQKLITGSVDPDEFRTKVITLKTQFETELAIFNAQMDKSNENKEFIENQIGVLRLQFDTINRSNSKTDEEIINNYNIFVKTSEDIVHSLQEFSNLTNKIKQLQSDKQRIVQINAQIKEIDSSIGSKTATLSEFDQKSNMLPDLKQKLLENNNKINTLSEEKKFLVWERNKQEFISRLGFDTGPNAGQAIQSRIDSLSQQIKDSKNKEMSLSRDLAIMALNKTTHSCPDCGTALGIENGRIVAKHHFSQTDFDNMSSDLKQFQTQTKTLETELNQMVINLNDYNNLISQYKQLVTKKSELSFDVIESSLVNIVTENNQINQHISSINAHIQTQIMLKSDISQLTARKNLLLDSVPVTDCGDEKGLLAAHATLSAKIQQLNSTKDLLLNASEELQEMKQRAAKKESLFSSIQTLNGLLQQKNTEIDQLKQSIIKTSSKIGSCKRLIDLSKQASMETVDFLLEKINFYAANMIGGFFPNDGTSIKLKNSYETQKGEQKPKISLEIFHKGMMPKKLSSLSGGEKSRITLAFQMAMSELYNSPILMIDEGFVGLPIDQKLECLEMLRPMAQKKLVCVIEHGLPEYAFDQIIKV